MAGKAQGMKIWRKVITLFALAFALVIFADGFKTVSRAETGTTNNAVNMRKTPSKNGDLVQKLEKGTSVELGDLVDGKDGDGKKWYAVTANGKSGYIRSDLINKGSSTSTSTNEGTVSGEVESVTPVGASVAGSNTVRVRTSASTTSSNNILATVAKGTQVTVIGKIVGSDKKTWYQVKLTVEGNEVVGYIRSDYLVISGEVKPVETTTATPDPVENTDPVEVDPKPEKETPTVQKRYETKLINDEWWIQDHDKNEQYKIEQLFSAANEYKNRYEEANKKAKSRKGWMIFFLLLALAACGAAGYLLFRLKETKEAAFIASIENNTPRRTSDRPREARGQQGGGRPAIKDGLEPRSRDERPANGQRSSGNRPQQGQRPAQPGQGQRPANGQQPAQGQRPANGQQPAQGQRPAGGQQPTQGQRPTQPGQGQRPEGQPQRPAQPAQGQRPAENQQRPAQQPQQRPEVQQQRPAQPAQGQRPAENQQRPAQPQQTAARPKNFVQDSDDMEFEFLNWDSDE